MTKNTPKKVYTKEDIKAGLTIGKYHYPTTGGVWMGEHQIAGACNKPYRYTIARLVRSKKVKGGFIAAKKAMLEAGVLGVYPDTFLRDL